MFISVHFLGFFSLFHSINILNYTDKQSTAQIHPNLQCKPSTLSVCEIRERHIRKKQTTCLLSQILQFLSSYDSSRRCQLPVWKKKLYSTSFIPIKEHDRRTYFLTVCWYLLKSFTVSYHNHHPSNEKKFMVHDGYSVLLTLWLHYALDLIISHERNDTFSEAYIYRGIAA